MNKSKKENSGILETAVKYFTPNFTLLEASIDKSKSEGNRRNKIEVANVRKAVKILFPFTVTDGSTSNELDFMPKGWLYAFGLEMMLELKNLLKKYNFIHLYSITEIKEKRGQLKVTGFIDSNKMTPEECIQLTKIDKASFDIEYNNLILKYEELSLLYCSECGKKVKYNTYRLNSYENLLCTDCFNKLFRAMYTTLGSSILKGKSPTRVYRNCRITRWTKPYRKLRKKYK